MSAATIIRSIRRHWRAIVDASGCIAESLSAKPGPGSRLLSYSAKLAKGNPTMAGFLPAIVYLAPGSSSGRNACPNATAQCISVCLASWSARMRWASNELARLWRTALYFGDRKAFRALLHAETQALATRAAKLGLVAAVRPDGGSDLGEGPRLATAYPGIQVWDYTKSEARARRYLRGGFPANYHVTLSYTGHNAEACKAFLAAGGNVAVIIDGPRPATFLGFPTVSGDASDLRFLDPRGTVAVLSFKGPRDRLDLAGAFVVRARTDPSGNALLPVAAM